MHDCAASIHLRIGRSSFRPILETILRQTQFTIVLKSYPCLSITYSLVITEQGDRCKYGYAGHARQRGRTRLQQPGARGTARIKAFLSWRNEMFRNLSLGATLDSAGE